MSKKKAVKDPQTMEELLAQTNYKLHGLKKGAYIVGTVAEKKGKTLFIDVGAKTEAIVTGKELALVKDFVSLLKIGDEIEVQVRVPENERGQTLVSLRKAATDYGWEFFEEKKKTKTDVVVTGREDKHGGLIVIAPLGLLGFIPGSQIGKKYHQDPREMVGKKVKVKVIEVDRSKNRLVFSERLASEPEEVAKEKELVNRIKSGEKFKATVVRIEPFGLFVQIKVGRRQLEGLVHISEVSWEKVEGLSGLYQVGSKIDVVLLNKEGDRLQFSIKRLKPDPWENIKTKYPMDKQIKGTVVRLASFGALVRLEPGIEGLIHISKISPEAEITVGQEVSCYIESLDKEGRRLSLGFIPTGKKIPIYK